MKKILFFLFLLTLSFYIVNAGVEDYTIYYGTLTLQSSNVAAGQAVSATIDGIAAGSTTTTATGEYKLLVTLPTGSSDGAAITFTLSTPSGYDSVNSLASYTTYSTGNNGKYVNLNLAFTGTPTAAAAAAAAAAPSGGGSAMASAKETAPTAETLTKITDLTKVTDIIASLPEGWTNVDVYQIGSPISETVKETLATVVESALKYATQTESISALQDIQNKINSGEISQLSIIKTLSVYKVTNKDSGQSIYRTKITVTFTAPNDLKNVKIIETIPHAVVDSIAGIDFLGIKPEILQTDPIFQWSFDSVKKSETKSIDYIIKKKIDKIETITIAVGEEEKIEKKTFLPITAKAVIGIMVIIIIVLAGLFIYYHYLKKKEGKKEKKGKKKR